MAVVFVNRYFYPDASATSQILSDLVFGLARESISVRVVTSRQNYHDKTRVFPAREMLDGVDIRRVWSTCFGRIGLLGRFFDSTTFIAAAAFKLLFSLRKNDKVVIMTDPPMIGWVIFMVAKLRGAKSLNWTQDVFPETAQILKSRWVSGPLMSLLKTLRDASFRGAYMNIVIGERMAEYFLSRGISSAKIRVIHNWSDGKHIYPIPKENNPLLKMWDLRDRFIVGYSGNMGRVHEFETILRAAEILLEDKKFVFLFTADGYYRDHVASLAADRKLTNIYFKPPQAYKDLAPGLGVSDVHLVCLRPDLESLVVPSKFYGIAAAGRPVIFIGDADGEIARLVQAHECGVVVVSGDGRMLAATLKQLEENRGLTLQMGVNARALFEKMFEKQHAFRQWKEVIR